MNSQTLVRLFAAALTLVGLAASNVQAQATRYAAETAVNIKADAEFAQSVAQSRRMGRGR